MIFGTRQDQHFDFNLEGNKFDICTDLNILALYLQKYVLPPNKET